MLARVALERLTNEVRQLQQSQEARRSQFSRLQERFSHLLLTPQETADRLGISTRTLRRWRKAGRITPVEGVPGVRYHPGIVAELVSKGNRP